MSSSTSSENVAECSDNTVIGLLQELSRKVSNIETVLGGVKQQSLLQKRRAHGIDIVLGAQWGDEGKGKLVDMLSQVRVSIQVIRIMDDARQRNANLCLFFSQSRHSFLTRIMMFVLALQEAPTLVIPL